MDQKIEFLKEAGFSDEAIAELQPLMNSFKERGEERERKEKSEDNDAPAAPESTEPVTAEETVAVLKEIVLPLVNGMASLNKRLQKTEELVKALSASDADKISATKEMTPRLSLSDLLTQSIVGNADAAIDGRSSLAKSKPVETEAPAAQVTGVPFLDSLLAGGGAE